MRLILGKVQKVLIAMWIFFFRVFVILEKYLLLFIFDLSIENVRLVIFRQVEFLFQFWTWFKYSSSFNSYSFSIWKCSKCNNRSLTRRCKSTRIEILENYAQYSSGQKPATTAQNTRETPLKRLQSTLESSFVLIAIYMRLAPPSP